MAIDGNKLRFLRCKNAGVQGDEKRIARYPAAGRLPKLLLTLFPPGATWLQMQVEERFGTRYCQNLYKTI